MKKTIIYIIILFTFTNCSSFYTVYNKENNNYFNGKEVIKSYELNKFDIYVFNICEKYSNKINSIDRFYECPKNFYDIAEKEQIKKIEEVYILIHKETNLALYLPTFSHKYIYKDQTGYLNDRDVYENSIILDQIEYFYIGKIDRIKSSIFFDKPESEKDIYMHFDNQNFPENIFLKKVNIATAENKYTINNEIDLEDVFSNKLDFKKSNFKMYYYKNIKQINIDEKKLVNTIYMLKNKGKLELVFDYENKNNEMYNIRSKAIPYQPNFKELQDLK